MREEIESFVKKILGDELDIEEANITPDFLIKANLDNLHLTFVQILVEIEKKYDVQVDEKIIYEDITFEEFINQIMLFVN